MILQLYNPVAAPVWNYAQPKSNFSTASSLVLTSGRLQAKMTSLFFVSLPYGAIPGSMGEPETRLKQWVESNIGASHGVASIALPDLKIGLLDNLVEQTEEVAKLDAQLQSILLKCHESIVSIFNDDPTRIHAVEQVDGKPAWAYLQQFGWNTAKYRPEKSIQTLLASLSQEAFSADQDLKTRLQQYQQTKQRVQAIDRKYCDDLSVRSLESVVRMSDVVQNSEYLTSVLVAVPLKQEKTFLSSYETLTPMVVPRSAHKISTDAAFVLYSVTLFTKFVKEFEIKAREAKWVPRDLPQAILNRDSSVTTADTDAVYRQENEIRNSERRQWRELERLAAVTFSDIIKVWGHIKVIRVFVESVLRYGLPVSYVTATFEPKISAAKAEAKLIKEFSFLGGNAVNQNAKGELSENDISEFSALVEHDYKPFVIYISKLP